MELVALFAEHAPRRIFENHRQLTGKAGFPGPAVGYHRSHHQTRTVLVLQTLSTQGRAAGSSPQQQTTGTLVSGSPDQIADALETEHRVVDVHRQHRFAVHRIRRCRRHPGGNRPGFGDPLLQQLTVTGFLVRQQRAGILGLVALPLR
ncbi:hypothetical protein D3C84_1013650 [compost metagenome]